MKRIFPLIWAGGLLCIIADQLIRGVTSGQLPSLLFLIAPILMIPGGYFVMKKMGLLDLVDEVLDGGDELIVRNGGQETRVPLSEVTDVTYSALEPWRLTLLLQRPSFFGAQVSFMPPRRFLPFSTNPIVNELIERIDAKRRI